VRLTLDGATVVDLPTPPFTTTFPGLAAAEHTLAAIALDATGSPVPGTATEDLVIRAGIGNFAVAMGDSITESVGDDVPADDVSPDGRTAGGGYPPLLNARLTAARGRPQTVVNHGVPGTTSAFGVALIGGLLAKHPDAETYLLLFGMNDARPWAPLPSGLGLAPGQPSYPGTFKANLQQILDAVRSAGKTPVLAKIPIALGDCADPASCPPSPDPNTNARSVRIQEYNQVIDELVANPANAITTPPPDFYTYFATHAATEYADNIHPNGTGYQSMARLWCQALTGTACN